MVDHAYITLSAIGFFLNIVPFAWQVEHRNSGPICLGFWVLLLNLFNFIDAVIWRNDAIDRAPAWCDISSKIRLAAPIGLLAANVCIARFLARVVAPKATMISPRERRNRALADYALSLGLPVLVMATHIIYQPLRYGILRTVGCAFSYVLTWPTFVLWMIWRLILAAIAAGYSLYVSWRLLQHRSNFGKLVARTDSALTASRFLRLGLLSIAYAGFNLPLCIYTFAMDVRAAPYITYDWRYIHVDIKEVVTNPFVEKAVFSDYIAIISAFLVLAFFGFSSESLSYYARILAFVGIGWRQNCNEEADLHQHSPHRTVIVLNETNSLQDGMQSLPDEKDGIPGNDYTGPFASGLQSGYQDGVHISVSQYKSAV